MNYLKHFKLADVVGMLKMLFVQGSVTLQYNYSGI